MLLAIYSDVRRHRAAEAAAAEAERDDDKSWQAMYEEDELQDFAELEDRYQAERELSTHS
jgi:hypothetical protein